MKKRLIPLIALLLMGCLLLSSCAAGLPGADLFATAGERSASFGSKLKNLLQKNTPIVLDGNSDFALHLSIDATDEVRAAVAVLCDAITNKTGFDFNEASDTAAHKIVISLGKEAPDGTALNAASFFVGFDDKGELLIRAANDVMLISAIYYTVENFIDSKDANAGEGFWYLPRALAFVAPTLECSYREFTMIQSQLINPWMSYQVNELHRMIRETTGVRLSLKDDLLTPENVDEIKELLVGSPSRKASRDIAADLGSNRYFIGSNGTKVMVLANNYTSFHFAIQSFVATFIQSSDAEFDTESATLQLPSYCHYYHTLGENETVNIQRPWPREQQ